MRHNALLQRRKGQLLSQFHLGNAFLNALYSRGVAGLNVSQLLRDDSTRHHEDRQFHHKCLRFECLVFSCVGKVALLPEAEET